MPPYEVDDLGPIQGPCTSAVNHWSACGIDQPNLTEVACSSGADTVYGLYEEVWPEQGAFSSNTRVMHARLGRQRAAARPPATGASGQ